MSVLSGWGRVPRAACRVRRARRVDDVADAVRSGSLIARGNGRAYGDSAVNPSLTLDMTGMDRILSFDPETGVVVAEAGVLLADLIAVFLPRGWFPAVTPGTKFVSLGGAIAADVHGKNHHADGSFGQFVDWVDVMGPDGTITRASATENTALLAATLGGMGLCGVILRAAIRLRPVQSGYIVQETIACDGLDAMLAAFEAHADAPYSVGWIDCLAKGPALGRGLVMLGRHATPDDLRGDVRRKPFVTPKKRTKRVPFDAPQFALNSLSVRAFNALYYRAGRRKQGRQIVDWDSYFYPLDAILDWNRIYGRRGFYQFQCALPLDQGRAGLIDLLQTAAETGASSFLSVLKRFGDGSPPGGVSFPMPGYTLAMDFAANDRTLALLQRLDEITLAHGGRFYLAKDGRMARHVLEASDQRLDAFRALRKSQGWDRAFTSLQSERLGL